MGGVARGAARGAARFAGEVVVEVVAEVGAEVVAAALRRQRLKANNMGGATAKHGTRRDGARSFMAGEGNGHTMRAAWEGRGRGNGGGA